MRGHGASVGGLRSGNGSAVAGGDPNWISMENQELVVEFIMTTPQDAC